MGFMVFNKTDGIYAYPDAFTTRREAEKFLKDFRKRYDMQGYYKTGDGRRIDPADVELIILDGKDDAC